jgi:hypothetical protein
MNLTRKAQNGRFPGSEDVLTKGLTSLFPYLANVADEEERIQEGKLKVMHLPEKPKQVEAKFRVR